MLAKIGTSHVINTDAIRFIEALPPNAKGREQQRITFTDGSTLLVLSSEELIDRLTGQVVPAPAGYTVIEAYPPEDGETEPTFRNFPVIAFRVMTIDNVMPPMPITAAGEPENTWVLIWPDGQCDRQHEHIYDSVDAFKAHFRQQLAEDQQRAQAGAPVRAVTEPSGIDPAEVDAYALGLVSVLRQVELRHGSQAALAEGIGCIRAAVLFLDEFGSAGAASDTARWFATRSADPQSPEAEVPFALTDDGLPLPEPRSSDAAATFIMRKLRLVTAHPRRETALEIAIATMRAGVCIVREKTGAEMLAALLGHYAGLAETLAILDGERPAIAWRGVAP